MAGPQDEVHLFESTPNSLNKGDQTILALIPFLSVLESNISALSWYWLCA